METKDVRFTPYFEWCEKVHDAHYRIGITDAAQKTLGDIVYLELPGVGDRVEKDRACAFIESRKSVVDILAPLSGVVIEVNQALLSRPNVINQSAYENGWLLAISADNPQEWNDLLGQEPVSTD